MGIVIEADRDVPAGRALHLIDVENLAGGPDVSAEVARTAIDDCRRSAVVMPGDLVRLASKGHRVSSLHPRAAPVLRMRNGPMTGVRHAPTCCVHWSGRAGHEVPARGQDNGPASRRLTRPGPHLVPCPDRCRG